MRRTHRLTTTAAILGVALTGALFLAPMAKAAAAEPTLVPTATTPDLDETTPTLRTTPPISIPPITIPPLEPAEPAVPEGPGDLTDCPPSLRVPDNCRPPKPPCDANGDGKLTAADWVYLQQHPGACRRKPPCDANHDGKLDVADWFWLLRHPDACVPRPPCDANHDGKLDLNDWFWLRRHPDACRPPKPPCDANGDGKLDQDDWRHLRKHPDACRPPKPPCDANGDGKLDQDDWGYLARYPDACQPPSTSFRPPTRIDTGAGGTARDAARTGPSFGQLALIGAVLSGLAGGIATIPRRRRTTGSTR